MRFANDKFEIDERSYPVGTAIFGFTRESADQSTRDSRVVAFKTVVARTCCV
jgi:hypothetical protein